MTQPLDDDQILTRMSSLVAGWRAQGSARAIFLACYQMMTANMLAAIRRREFGDPAWVRLLLIRFADFYYAALAAYDQSPSSAPAAWRLAFQAADSPAVTAVQHLLLGVNAHINYDLALTLFDLLKPEWQSLAAAQQAGRYQDYCQVNAVIAATIDSVQDEVLEPAMPVMEVIDRLFGSADERMISSLITRWRETTWDFARRLLLAKDTAERTRLEQRLEQHALTLARLIYPQAALHRPGKPGSG